MTASSRPDHTIHAQGRSSLEWAAITLILLVAGFLRFHDLGNIPRGLEHDEVATWSMVRGVLEGDRPIYFEEGYGHEPLFNYLTAVAMALFGDNWLGERFWAPWLGLLAVALTYTLMRRMFNPLVGLGAAGFQGTVLWALFFNRLGLRLNQLPFLLTLTAYCFWRGVEACAGSRCAGSKSRLAWFAAAGVWMGLCFYTYMSSRIVLPIFGAFSVYLVARDRWMVKPACGDGAAWRGIVTRWWPLLVCFVVAGLVMMPLVLYLVGRPTDTATPQREEQVNAPLTALMKGDLRPVLQNAWAMIKMWNVDGERYWQLNYSHRPVFVEPISGILFWLGALIALWRWKEPRMALLALWVGLGMVPSLLTSEAPSWPRTMLASPAALALPGIAVEALLQRLRKCEIRLFVDLGLCRAAGVVLIALLALSLLATGALTYRDFLVVWPRHPRVRYAFQSSLTEALRCLDLAACAPAGDPQPVVMAGLSPHDMDPLTERSTLRRQDLSIRWVDTRSSLVLPAGERAWLILLDITPVEPALYEWADLMPRDVLARGDIVPRGGTEDDPQAPLYYDPAYTIYSLDVATLRQRIDETAQSKAYVGADPFAAESVGGLPQFGSLVRFAGYEWLTPPIPGGPARLLTFWRALAAGPRSTVYGEPSLRVFVHLLDAEQSVVAAADALGAAPDTWRPGDVIVQVHAFAFPSQRGEYALEVGWYVPPHGPRLPVDGVDAPSQRILLEGVEIGA